MHHNHMGRHIVSSVVHLLIYTASNHFNFVWNIISKAEQFRLQPRTCPDEIQWGTASSTTMGYMLHHNRIFSSYSS